MLKNIRNAKFRLNHDSVLKEGLRDEGCGTFLGNQKVPSGATLPPSGCKSQVHTNPAIGLFLEPSTHTEKT